MSKSRPRNKAPKKQERIVVPETLNPIDPRTQNATYARFNEVFNPKFPEQTPFTIYEPILPGIQESPEFEATNSSNEIKSMVEETPQFRK